MSDSLNAATDVYAWRFLCAFSRPDRAASVVGNACSVEDDPPAVIVNSSLGGAGVVAGGAVVEHW